MFDVLSQAMYAWHSTTLILIGVVFSLVGSIFFVNLIYWRAIGRKVAGKIHAVAVKSKAQAAEEVREDWKGDADSTFGKKEALEIKSRKEKVEKKSKFIILFPAIFALAGLYFAYDYTSVEANGVHTSGTIVRYNVSTSSDSGPSYFPVVRFKDAYGRTHEVADNVSSSRSKFIVGQTYDIVYDPEKPARINLGGFWHNMIVPLIFVAFGVSAGAAFLGIISLPDRRKKKQLALDMGKTKESYTGEMYTNIYRYEDGGKSYDVIAPSSSSSVVGRIPGTDVSLRVDRNDFERGSRFSLPWLIISLFFLIPGLVCTALGVMSYDLNVFSLLLTLGFACFIVLKLMKAKKNYDAQYDAADVLERRRVKRERKKKRQVLLNKQEFASRYVAHMGHAMLGVCITLVLGVGMMGGGYVWAERYDDFQMRAVSVEGRISDLNTWYSHTSSSSVRTLMYSPVVTFKTLDGQTMRHDSKRGTNRPTYRVGDTVRVMYDPGNPARAKIDRGIFNNLEPFFVMCFGILFFMLGVRNWLNFKINKRRFERYMDMTI